MKEMIKWIGHGMLLALCVLGPVLGMAQVLEVGLYWAIGGHMLLALVSIVLGYIWPKGNIYVYLPCLGILAAFLWINCGMPYGVLTLLQGILALLIVVLMLLKWDIATSAEIVFFGIVGYVFTYVVMLFGQAPLLFQNTVLGCGTGFLIISLFRFNQINIVERAKKKTYAMRAMRGNRWMIVGFIALIGLGALAFPVWGVLVRSFQWLFYWIEYWMSIIFHIEYAVEETGGRKKPLPPGGELDETGSQALQIVGIVFAILVAAAIVYLLIRVLYKARYSAHNKQVDNTEYNEERESLLDTGFWRNRRRGIAKRFKASQRLPLPTQPREQVRYAYKMVLGEVQGGKTLTPEQMLAPMQADGFAQTYNKARYSFAEITRDEAWECLEQAKRLKQQAQKGAGAPKAEEKLSPSMRVRKMQVYQPY